MLGSAWREKGKEALGADVYLGRRQRDATSPENRGETESIVNISFDMLRRQSKRRGDWKGGIGAGVGGERGLRWDGGELRGGGVEWIMYRM